MHKTLNLLLLDQKLDRNFFLKFVKVLIAAYLTFFLFIDMEITAFPPTSVFDVLVTFLIKECLRDISCHRKSWVNEIVWNHFEFSEYSQMLPAVQLRSELFIKSAIPLKTPRILYLFYTKKKNQLVYWSQRVLCGWGFKFAAFRYSSCLMWINLFTFTMNNHICSRCREDCINNNNKCHLINYTRFCAQFYLC